VYYIGLLEGHVSLSGLICPGLLCGIGKGKIVLRTCRAEHGVEGPRRTGKGLEDVLENESEENMETGLE